MRVSLKLTSTSGEKTTVPVNLNPHLLWKMEQAQRNFKRCMWGHNGYATKGYSPRRARYWARQFRKWTDLLIERAYNDSTQQTSPSPDQETGQG